MISITRYVSAALISIVLVACGGGDNEDSSSSGDSASLAGTWINSRGTSSWTFPSGGSGDGTYKTLSIDGKTCDIIYLRYTVIDPASGTFSYYSTGEEYVGAYPVPKSNPNSKVYTSAVRVSGSSATIEGESYTLGNSACRSIGY